MNRRSLSGAMIMAAFLASCQTAQVPEPAVIPQPVMIDQKPGSFTLAPDATITSTGGPEAEAVAEQIVGWMKST